MILMRLVLLQLLIPICASASTFRVGPNTAYPSVKSALLKAKSKDSIVVQHGIYCEGNILIDKAIFLIGINHPVLDGKEKFEMISVKSDGVTVSGFKLINSAKSDLIDYAAIKVYDSHNDCISDNILENNFFGIYLSNSGKCVVSGNSIHSENKVEHASGNGIHLWHCDHIRVNNNTVSGHRDGIYFEFVTEAEILNNTSTGNLRYGLHFMFSNNDQYRNNTFRDNGAGVAVMFSYKVKMINNRFEHNWGSASYGLLLKEIRDSEISGNTFLKNSTGITMEGTTRILINNNNFVQNGWAMQIGGGSEQCVITKNNVIGNTFDVTTSGTSNNNDFDGNYWDKYGGYDLNKDGIGDTPFFPVSLSALIMEKVPASLLFLHSFILTLIDQSEKLAPQLIPQNIIDNRVSLKKYLQ